MITTGYESLQLVAFFAGFPTANDAASLWMRHFPEPYAAFNKPAPGVSVASGTHDHRAYELHLHPARIDLVVAPEATESGPPRSVAELNELAVPALAMFQPLMSDLTVVRVAAVAKHRQAAPDMAGAVARIRKLLPSLPVTDGDVDVSFQRSRPTSSATQSDLRINQLMRWTTGIGVEMLIQVGPNGVPTQLPGQQHAFVEQLLDFNTSPETRPDVGKLQDIFAELISGIAASAGKEVKK